MNEFEKLEAELKELRPVAPSDEFTARLESALGDAGKVAMCCMPEERSSAEQTVSSSSKNNKVVSFPRLAAFIGIAGLGLAAVWTAIFYVSTSLVPAGPSDLTDSDNTILANNDKILPFVVPVNDPDSPINGLSLNQIQDLSVLPVSGWLDPQTNERFLRMVDEGIFRKRMVCLPVAYATSLWTKLCGVTPPLTLVFFRLPRRGSHSDRTGYLLILMSRHWVFRIFLVSISPFLLLAQPDSIMPTWGCIPPG